MTSINLENGWMGREREGWIGRGRGDGREGG